ncbi:hypothetical protein PUR71_13040 [Streptomyces sp. SP17BM10]|uniref:hypothetical protein n=1 Tax=Streptomyces sp. SP17BM10 TaxID=3002530 RepID=UPI002E76B58D|nr:hypothetical protein [Streptomyces sp. SP17BM10]MEE1783826.1 hypothetical protein [Streptomyces sp. SP17BM10]
MYVLDLSTTSWWLIAALCTAVNLALLVPSMPTRATRIRVSSMPVIIAVFAYVASVAKPGYPPQLLLSMYSIACLMIPVSLLGFRRKMARMVLERPEDGSLLPEHYGLAQEAMIRFTVAAVAMGGLVYLFKP